MSKRSDISHVIKLIHFGIFDASNPDLLPHALQNRIDLFDTEIIKCEKKKNCLTFHLFDETFQVFLLPNYQYNFYKLHVRKVAP